MSQSIPPHQPAMYGIDVVPPPNATGIAFVVVIWAVPGGALGSCSYFAEAGVAPELAYHAAREVIDRHDKTINQAPSS